MTVVEKICKSEDKQVLQLDRMIYSLGKFISTNELREFVHSYWSDKLPISIVRKRLDLYFTTALFSMVKDISFLATCHYSIDEIKKIITKKYKYHAFNNNDFVIRFAFNELNKSDKTYSFKIRFSIYDF